MSTIRFGSLFTGIGGIDLGLERAGMECAWQCEINDAARLVLRRHWPDVTIIKDVRDVNRRSVRAVELVCGGFPCQPHSLAGQRRASTDERDMWPEFARVIRELKPRWVVAENVTGILSSENGRYFGGILRDLAQSGYDAAWDVLPAAAFGAIHERQRVFIVAHANSTRLAQRRNVVQEFFAPNEETQKDKQANRPSDLAPSEYLSSARDWPSESVFLRADHGVSHRMDRVRMIGNAVVPQVAEWIGRRIMELEKL